LEKDKLIADWLEAETSPEEREEMERIIALTEQFDAPANKTKAATWDDLMAGINEKATDNERVLAPQQKSGSKWMIYAASIAAVMVLGYFALFNNGTSGLVNFETATAEIITKKLPDASEVTLNALSSLSFSEKKWSSERTVDLKGEAFFEVTEGSTFTVNTDLGKVAVLGTSFNVYHRDSDFTVACFTGSVQVNSKNDQVILKPGQKTTIDNQSGRFTVQNFNPQQSATWRIGEFYFDAVALSKVIRELERQFDIEIEVNGDISERFYTGFFSTQSLEEALQLVFVPMGLSSQVNGGIVTVE
jgi:ferric-dicitrate binding protein FerR (iron transport regulator)